MHWFRSASIFLRACSSSVGIGELPFYPTSAEKEAELLGLGRAATFLLANKHRVRLQGARYVQSIFFLLDDGGILRVPIELRYDWGVSG